MEDIYKEIMRYVFQDKPNPYVLFGMLEALADAVISNSEEQPGPK